MIFGTISSILLVVSSIRHIVIASDPKGYCQRRLRYRFAGTKGTVKLIDNAFWLVVDSGEMLRISDNCKGLQEGQQVSISNVQLVETFEVYPVVVTN